MKYLRQFFLMGLGFHFLVPPDEGGGGSGDAGDAGKKGGEGKPDAAALAAENAALKARLAALEKPKDESDDDEEDEEDDDLLARSRKAGRGRDDDKSKVKQLESAIAFNMKSADFLKANERLLPNDVATMFQQAEKEKFEDASEKAAAIKSGLIQSFFQVQANVELLTAGQRAQLDDFLKLTKNGKQEKAPHVYEMIFEPAFERLKDMKKAEALRTGRHIEGSVEGGYKDRLHKGAMKRFKIQEKNQ